MATFDDAFAAGAEHSIAHIAWINLDRQPDRREHMETLFAGCRIPNTRISGIDGRQAPNAGRRNQGTAEGTLSRFVTNAADMRLEEPRNDGEIASTLSHLKALHFLASQPGDYFLVLEDDINLDPLATFAPLANGVSPAENILRRAPATFDILLLHHISGHLLTDEYTRIYGPQSPIFSIAAYVVSRRGLNRLLALFDFCPMTNMFTFHHSAMNVGEPYLNHRLTTWAYRWNLVGTEWKFDSVNGSTVDAGGRWVAATLQQEHDARQAFIATLPDNRISWGEGAPHSSAQEDANTKENEEHLADRAAVHGGTIFLSAAAPAGGAGGAAPCCHVVYINLDRSVARRERMETQLRAACRDVLPFTRIRAVDPAEFSGSAAVVSNGSLVLSTDSGAPVRPGAGAERITPAEIACTLSHLKALHFLASTTDDPDARFLVLEDDVDFWNAQTWFAENDFGRAPLENILRRAPASFGALMLHHLSPTALPTYVPCVMQAEFSQVDEKNMTAFGPAVSAAAYVITRRAIQRLLETSFSYDPATERFRFRDHEVIEEADHFVFRRCETWVYKYNFVRPRDEESTLNHPCRHHRLFNFHVDHQMDVDAGTNDRITWVVVGGGVPPHPPTLAPRGANSAATNVVAGSSSEGGVSAPPPTRKRTRLSGVFSTATARIPMMLLPPGAAGVGAAAAGAAPHPLSAKPRAHLRLLG